MNIRFREIDAVTQNDFEFLEKWNHDPELRPLNYPCTKDGVTQSMQSKEEIRERIKSCCDREFILILDGEKPIGEMGFGFDPPFLLRKIPNSAWIHINLGDKNYWGTGAAEQAMRHLENCCRTAGAERIELGVFAFNERAIRFYKRMGYQKIGIIPEFTYWNSKMWDDIRMEKLLR